LSGGTFFCSHRRHQYDKSETARSLGIGVSSLYRKMDKLKISKSEDDHSTSDGIVHGLR
jgi:DNA-binding NtrC family response regulator